MSEKPVIDSFLVKVRTEFRGATNSIRSLQTRIENLIDKVELLEGKRIKLNLDTTGLKKSIRDITGDVDRLRDLMDKMKGGDNLTKKELKEMEALVGQIKLKNSFTARAADLAKAELATRSEELRVSTQSLGIIGARNQEYKRAVEHMKKTGKVTDTVADNTEKLWTADQVDNALKLSRYVVGMNNETKRLLHLGSKKFKEVASGEDWPVTKAGDAMDRMVDIYPSIQKTKKSLEAAMPMIKAYSESTGAGPDAKKSYDVAQARLKQLTAWGRSAQKAQGYFKKLGESEKAGGDATKKALPYYQSTNRVIDEIIGFRTEKFPFFGTFNIPKQMGKDLAFINQNWKNQKDVIDKWSGTFKNTMGSALTYTGQFDKRMRYLSRDLYIFGIYAQQIAQGAVNQFKGLIKASSDLEGAFEDLTLANEDLWAPFGDAIAPIIEDLAEVVETMADFTENMPGRGAIGFLMLFGTVLISIGATIIRSLSMWNLWKNSAAVMIQQQKELAAAQVDHERQIYNVGVQYQSTAAKLKYLTAAGVDQDNIQKMLAHDYAVIDGEMNQIRRDMVKFGGDTTKFLSLIALGGVDASHAMKVLAKETPESLHEIFTEQDAMKKFRKGMQDNESAMEEFNKHSQGKAGGFFDTMGGLGRILQGKAVVSRQEVLEERLKASGMSQERLNELTGIYKKKTDSARSGIRKGTSSMYGMVVAGGMLAAVMVSLSGITEQVGSIMESFLEPLQPFFDWLEEKLEQFENWMSNQPGWAQVGIGIGFILGTALLLKLGSMLVVGLAGIIGKAIWGAVTGTTVKTAAGGLWATITGALGGLGTWLATSISIPILGITAPIWAVIAVIIAAIGLIWLAWKNNWGNIQEKTKAVLDWLKKRLEAIGDWIGENLVKPMKKWWKQVFGTQLGKGGQGGHGSVANPGTTTGKPWWKKLLGLQSGGIVRREGLFGLHSGEVVVPARATRDLSRSNVTNHIYVNVTIDRTSSNVTDDRAIAKVVSDQIARELGRRI